LVIEFAISEHLSGANGIDQQTMSDFRWFDSDQRARRGYGFVLAITRGWRHAAHGASPAA
jgi:hypothetical protein